MSNRETLQKRLVREAFSDAGRPLRPEEVLESARKKAPRIGIATVYRTIKSLLSSKTLSTVELPGQPARYELFSTHHHHHFHCRNCKKVFEVEVCPKGIDQIGLPGFTVERHDVTLYGRCADCQSSKPKENYARH